MTGITKLTAGDLRWTEDPPLLDWTDTAEHARAALTQHADAQLLVVRRIGADGRPLYYVISRDQLSSATLSPSMSLADALALGRLLPNDTFASKAEAAARMREGRIGSAVVSALAGRRISVGVIEALASSPSQLDRERREVTLDTTSAAQPIREEEAPAPSDAAPSGATFAPATSRATPPVAETVAPMTSRAKPPAHPTFRGRLPTAEAVVSVAVSPTARLGATRRIKRNGGSRAMKAKKKARRPTSLPSPVRAPKPAPIHAPTAARKMKGGGRVRARIGVKKNGSHGHAAQPKRTAKTGISARAAVRPPSRSSVDWRDPPRSSYALARAPERVKVGVEFELRAGLTRKAEPGVDGGKVTRPPSSKGAYTLDVQVVTEGFDLHKDDHWRRKLSVSVDEPYPYFVLRLTARKVRSKVMHRLIEVKFAIDGQLVGRARRWVVVSADARALSAEPLRKPSGATFGQPQVAAADLTATVSKSEEKEGRLLWTFDLGPKLEIVAPEEAIPSDVGKAPRQFANRLARLMTAREGKANLYGCLSGPSKEIRANMPPKFFALLRQVAAKVGKRPPTVLFYTEDSHIPWELAAVAKPLLDPEAPPFLAAQVAVGRWVPGVGLKPRPPFPPPDRARGTTMAVINAKYPGAGQWGPLRESVAEANDLIEKFGATLISADVETVAKRLARPRADVLHFACHGNFDRRGLEDGLIMIDGTALTREEIEDLDLRRRPFVFLNACQTGRESESLGDYAGLAQAFLVAGASGVIAPRWAINDGVARSLAVRFYDRVRKGERPAEVMRQERRRFQSDPPPRSSTWMSYVFYGHPQMEFLGGGKAP
jgi:hypothetical protein